MTAKSFSPPWGCFSEKAARALRGGCLGALLMCAAGASVAQAQSQHSALANVDLPSGSHDWSADDDGSKGATLDFAASLAGAACGAREARAWPAASGAAADDVTTRANSVLLEAKWTLEPLSRTPDGQSILQARRGPDRLIVVWQPAEGEIGLLMCRVEGATAEAPAGPAGGSAGPAAAAEVPDVAPEESAAPRASRIDDAFGPPVGRSQQEIADAASAPDAAKAPAAAEPAGPPAKESSTPAPVVVEAAPAEEPAGDDSFPAVLVAVLALVGGGIALIVREAQARRQNAAWQWPTARTTIERGWVEEEEVFDRRGVPVTTYLPVLKYRYAVDGQDYEGSQIGLDDAPMATADAARGRLAGYPDFTSVEVRYDPQDPSFAVIEAPRPKPGLDFYFGIGAIVIALGVLLSHFF